MATIISTHSFRGGTGKSNTTANLAALLATDGQRVGVIDTDVYLKYSDHEQRLAASIGETASFANLRSAGFHLPASPARELKVWAHQITPEGNSEALPAWAEVHSGKEVIQYDLKSSAGQVVLPATGGVYALEIALPICE